MEELDKQNIQKERQDVIDEVNSSKNEDVKNTDNIKPNKKPKLTKKFYILTGIFGAVFAGIGTLSGVMIGQEVFAVSTDYSSIDIDNLEDDNEALIKKYKSTSEGCDDSNCASSNDCAMCNRFVVFVPSNAAGFTSMLPMFH